MSFSSLFFKYRHLSFGTFPSCHSLDQTQPDPRSEFFAVTTTFSTTATTAVTIEASQKHHIRTTGRTDGRTDGCTDGRTDGRRDGRTDGRMDGRTDGRKGKWRKTTKKESMTEARYCDLFSLWRQIFEGKFGVSPYFLHHSLNISGSGMLLENKLSLKTLGVYISIIFWAQK